MICEFGDVVVVPFLFVERTSDKRRPSAVLSGHDFNTANSHSICAMITTAARTYWSSDILISDLASAGLPRDCVVRWKLFTRPNEFLLRRAGNVAGDDPKRVVATMRVIMT